MPLLKDIEFKKLYKSDKTKLDMCYLFYGQETSEIDETVADIIKNNIDEALKGFNLSVFSLESCNIDDVRASVVQAPLIGEKRIVVLNGQTALKVPKPTVAALGKILDETPPTTCVVLAFLETEDTQKKSSNLRALIKDFSKYGTVVEFGKWGQYKIARYLKEYASEQNCELSDPVAVNLIDRCGNSLLNLKNELDKLCAYKSSGEINNEDVEKLTEQTIHNSAFELARAVLRGDSISALGIFHNLIKDNNEPLNILGAINMTFVDLYRAKCLLLENKDTRAITDFYSYRGSEFRLRKSIDTAHKFNMNKIEYCLKLLRDIDYESKTTSNDLNVTIQTAIILMIKGS